jgi:hypothetical protein
VSHPLPPIATALVAVENFAQVQERGILVPGKNYFKKNYPRHFTRDTRKDYPFISDKIFTTPLFSLHNKNENENYNKYNSLSYDNINYSTTMINYGEKKEA